MYALFYKYSGWQRTYSETNKTVNFIRFVFSISSPSPLVHTFNSFNSSKGSEGNQSLLLTLNVSLTLHLIWKWINSLLYIIYKSVCSRYLQLGYEEEWVYSPARYCYDIGLSLWISMALLGLCISQKRLQ